MSPNAIEEVLNTAVMSGQVPGLAAFVATADTVIHESAWGKLRLGDTSCMTTDAVYWLASQTKAIVSAAAMQLVEQGRINLDDPVYPYLPELANPNVLEGFGPDGAPLLRPAKGEISLRHLLSHTSGLSYDMFNGDIARLHELHSIPNVVECRKSTLMTPLVSDPGERWVYGISTDWVGQLIERVTQSRLDEYLREQLLDPLGMHDTRFILTDCQRDRLMGMHLRTPDGFLGEVPFEVTQQPEFFMGGGGLYSTGPDYIRFQQMILRHGRAQDGKQILRPETVAEMICNQTGDLPVTPLESGIPAYTNRAEFLPGIPKRWSLAFMINMAPAPTGRSAGSLSWAGLGNSYFWIDPIKNVAGLLVAQVIPFADSALMDLFNDFEAAVYTGLPR